ncbi:triosephosphate isomerase [Candidatus Kaiserbacteria bacterium]|nr:triosephosphate isomerase [Candidatus Kaiserbacteria bacterium]
MLIVANWKAYVEDLARAKKLLAVSKRLARQSQATIVLAPPAPLLGALALNNRSNVAFAAQDISVTTGGAQTGEITAGAFEAVGAAYALIGHSERRARGDTAVSVAEKISHALAQGLRPILCVGEPERDAEGRYLSFIREELTSALSAVAPRERAEIIVAYEPLWAIGKSADAAASANDLGEMTLYIRKVLAELLPGRPSPEASARRGKSSRESLVLYGGSVEPDNIRDLAASSGLDGFLIGHASVDPRLFAASVKQLA